MKISESEVCIKHRAPPKDPLIYSEYIVNINFVIYVYVISVKYSPFLLSSLGDAERNLTGHR